MTPIDILMLDDNPSDILLAKEAFARESVINRLFCVSTEKEAFDFLSKNEVDLIMVDIHLGHTDGLSFIEAAKDAGLIKDSPIVVVSGSQDPEVAARADLLGVDAWIDKPLNIKKLNYLVMHVPELFMAVVMNKSNQTEVA